MEDGLERKLSLYERRFEKELNVSEADIEARMKWSLPVLSTNSKCGVSLDLPMQNCRPTKICAAVCYACQGTQLYKRSVIKSLAVERMIQQDPERVARKMVDEGEGRVIRVAGSGELTPAHKTLLDHVEAYGGAWWGFTRRVDTHRVLPRLMFSFDVTTPESVMDYVRTEVPTSRRAYLRQPGDPQPSLEVAVSFPVHGSRTPLAEQTPYLETDCPAARGEVAGCWGCRRCY